MKKAALVFLALSSFTASAHAAGNPRLQCTRTIVTSNGSLTRIDQDSQSIAILGYNSVKKRFVGHVDLMGMSASPGDSYCSYAIPAIEARYSSDLSGPNQGNIEITIGNGEIGKTSQVTGFVSKSDKPRSLELVIIPEAIPFDHDEGDADPACKDSLVVTCSLIK